MQVENLYYSDYLELNKILSAQHPKSASQLTLPAHDETLFIIVHQAFELWFLQVIHELRYIISSLHADQLDVNSVDMSLINQRLERITKIIRLINLQFDVLETMQPLAFLEFRGLLNPASGFQSKQFRIIEALLGLEMIQRHEPKHYKNTNQHRGGFSIEDFEEISEVEKEPTLKAGLKKLLHSIPFFEPEYWQDYQEMYPMTKCDENLFMSDYVNVYEQSLKEQLDSLLDRTEIAEERVKIRENHVNNVKLFKEIFLEKGMQSFTNKDLQSALFIFLYRDYPRLRLHFEIITQALEIDELITTWRHKHFLMVRKMIGSKPGTGGSPGAEYLMGAMMKNGVFQELSILSTYFIERDKLPILTPDLRKFLSFN